MSTSKAFVSQRNKCGKIFSGGKALGGQRKSHLPKSRMAIADHTKSPPPIREAVSNVVVEEGGFPNLLPQWVVKGKRGREAKQKISLSKRKKYICRTCNKSFNNQQGLGGHRSIHRRKKQDHSMSEQSDTSGIYEEHDMNLALSVSDAIADEGFDMNRSFQCTSCKRNFPSRQSLGSHKRWCFNTRKSNNEMHRKGLLLDLNEVPEETGDEN